MIWNKSQKYVAGESALVLALALFGNMFELLVAVFVGLVTIVVVANA